MTENLPIQNPPLADQVYDIILNSILNGEFTPGSKLPSENELADLYKVSRPTIRTAFSRLGELGYVIKKRGIGTFVSNTPSIVNPLYLSYDVMERISTRGHTPGFKQLSAQIISADKDISDKLDINNGSNVLHIQKMFTADADPIIYFENYIPEWIYQKCLSDTDVMEPGATEPFFQFFAHTCQQEVKFLTSIIHPALLRDCHLPDEFTGYDPSMAVLVVEDIGFSSDNSKLFLSKEHLFKDAGYFHVIRHVASS